MRKKIDYYYDEKVEVVQKKGKYSDEQISLIKKLGEDVTTKNISCLNLIMKIILIYLMWDIIKDVEKWKLVIILNYLSINPLYIYNNDNGKVMGGLGNQLFQIFTLLSYSTNNIPFYIEINY